jgi:hypothetical protein
MKANSDSELRDVIQSLNQRPASPSVEPQRKPADVPVVVTWAACLMVTAFAIAGGYANFIAQDSSPKQIAAMALTFLEIGGTYVVARSVHEIIKASR